MAIVIKNNSVKRELVEAGLQLARCVKMVEIGTCTENIMGQTKQLPKVNFSWELPLLTKVFEESKGPQPMMVSKEFTMSMAPKANLRKFLESWRGKPYTDEEAKGVDVTVLLGVPCMLNISHKPNKDGSQVYEDISAVTPPMKGLTIPPQVNPSVELSYDKWNEDTFKALPDFIKTKMEATPEYKEMRNPVNNTFVDDKGQPLASDLPWEVSAEETEEPLF